jgi:glycosyltransferase involved in cell wall biosynthesis
MKAAFLCPAYNRPRLLGHLIAMFQTQHYPDRELVILEDSGVFGAEATIQDQDHHWRIVSTDRRYESVGAKRNALARMTDAEVLLPVDDDDWYFPWHIDAAVEALSGDRPWAQPRQALEWDQPGQLGRYWVYGEPVRRRLNGLDPTTANDAYDCCYGGQWSYRRAEFLASGGYPEQRGNGDDTQWCRAMFKRFGPSADTISRRLPDPSYVYSRDQSGSWHASELGPGTAPLQKLADLPRASMSEFKIELPAGYREAIIPRETKPRKW